MNVSFPNDNSTILTAQCEVIFAKSLSALQLLV